MHKRKSINEYYTQLHSNKYIAYFGNLVRAKNLWEFNQHAVVWGITIGIMCAWIPLPFHTIIAVAIAILVDCNLTLVVVAIWFANPLTMPIMYYTAYRIGEALLVMPVTDISFHLSIKDLLAVFHEIWQPLLLGCLICSIICGVVAYFVVNLMWNSRALQDKLLSNMRK